MLSLWTPGHRTTALAAASVLALGAVAACGSEEAAGPAQATSTAPNGDVVGDADVTFATEMIPHHAQALVLVDTTLGRELDPALLEVLEGIRGSQSLEIQTLSGWLTSWGEPVPETARDHANAHGGGEVDAGHDMPGMVSAPDLASLERARGAAYEELLLELMLAHHEGAIEMARAEISDGAHQPAVDLARQIAGAQQREIATMEKLLDKTT